MKRVVISMVLILLYMSGYSQASTLYVVQDTTALKAYFGRADRILVMSDTSDYILCTTCVIDDSIVYAGVNGRKWLKMPKGNKVTNPISNGLMKIGGTTLVDSTLTIKANIVWSIAGTTYTRTTDTSFIIHTADSGYARNDLIYADTSGKLYKIQGVQDTSAAVTPTLPSNAVNVTVVNVFGKEIASPTAAVIGVIPNLLQVTNEGNSTTNPIVINNNTLQPSVQINGDFNRSYYWYERNANSGNWANVGFLLKNDVPDNPYNEHTGHFLQVYMGSTNSAFSKDGGLIRSNGTGGIKVALDSGKFVLGTGSPSTGNYTSRFEMGTNGDLSFLNYKNNATLDSVLATDQNGKVIMKKVSVGDIDVLQAPDTTYGDIKKLDGTHKYIVILADGTTGGSSGSSTYTASNGLTMVGNDIRLGGVINTTTLTSNGSGLNLTGGNSSFAIPVLNIYSSYSNYGIRVQVDGANVPAIYATADNNNGNAGIVGEANSGKGVFGFSNSGLGGEFSITSTTGVALRASDGEGYGTGLSGVTNLFELRKSNLDNAPNGYGISQNFILNRGKFGINGNSSIDTTTKMVSYWTDTTSNSRTAAFDIYILGNNIFSRKLSIAGSGKITADKYGSGTFTGTPTYNLGVDASGNIIEVASGGGTYTASNGLTMNGNDIELGGPTPIDGKLLSNRYIYSNGYSFNITGSSNNASFTSDNTGGSPYATGISGGGSVIGINGIANLNSTNNIGYGVQASNNDPTNNNIAGCINLYRTMPSSTVADGIGSKIDFTLPTNSAGATSVISTSIISKLTSSSNTTVTSEFSITGVNNAITSNILRIGGNGNAQFYGTVQLKGYTVATLPVGVQGMTAYVTDASSPAFLATVVGGGSTVVEVFYNGTNWIVQ